MRFLKYMQNHLLTMDDKGVPVFVFACVSCGKTVSGSERTCPRCGASFEDVRFECPFCGTLVSPDQHTCPSCKTEFSVFAGDVAETATIELDGDGGEVEEFECPACGKPVSSDDQKCPHCGALFSE